jgi:hypothetical protein
MKAKNLLVKVFAALVLVLGNLVVSQPLVWADGPVQGLPLGVATPWPAAQPLKLGQSFAPAQPLSPVISAPMVPLSQPPPVAVLPLNTNPAVIYVTPGPSQVTVPSAPIISVPPASSQIVAPIVNSGSTPNDALTPTGTWQTLGAGSAVWYLIATGGPHIDVWMTSEPHLNVTLDIFAPNQSNVPIGRGTPLKSDPTTMIWSGGSWRTNGNWYARVTNYYPAPIQYQLTSSATQIGTKDCVSYWEYIGPNPAYWTKCN